MESYSFELPPKFDVHKELEDSLNSLNQLRMVEEKALPRNVTAQIGRPVYLHCVVEPIGDKMVIKFLHFNARDRLYSITLIKHGSVGRDPNAVRL